MTGVHFILFMVEGRFVILLIKREVPTITMFLYYIILQQRKQKKITNISDSCRNKSESETKNVEFLAL